MREKVCGRSSSILLGLEIWFLTVAKDLAELRVGDRSEAAERATALRMNIAEAMGRLNESGWKLESLSLEAQGGRRDPSFSNRESRWADRISQRTSKLDTSQLAPITQPTQSCRPAASSAKSSRARFLPASSLRAPRRAFNHSLCHHEMSRHQNRPFKGSLVLTRVVFLSAISVITIAWPFSTSALSLLATL